MAKRKVKFIGNSPFEKIVLKKLEGLEKTVKFIRTDNAEMEDHLNGKIAALSQKMDQIGGRLDDKIERLEHIHPGNTHFAQL